MADLKTTINQVSAGTSPSLSESLRTSAPLGPATSPSAPATSVPSPEQVRERKSLTDSIREIYREVEASKTGKTDAERVAGLQAAFDSLKTRRDQFITQEFGRKGPDGKSLQDRIDETEAKLAGLEGERKSTISSNQWGQIAEQFGQALTSIAAGMYGMKHNVNLSGMKFERTNWEDRLKTLLGDINDRMDRQMGAATKLQAVGAGISTEAMKQEGEEREKLIQSDARGRESDLKAKADLAAGLVKGATTEYEAGAKSDLEKQLEGRRAESARELEKLRQKGEMARVEKQGETSKEVARIGAENREAARSSAELKAARRALEEDLGNIAAVKATYEDYAKNPGSAGKKIFNSRMSQLIGKGRIPRGLDDISLEHPGFFEGDLDPSTAIQKINAAQSNITRKLTSLGAQQSLEAPTPPAGKQPVGPPPPPAGRVNLREKKTGAYVTVPESQVQDALATGQYEQIEQIGR